MTDPITNRVAQILTESERVLVPIEKLFKQLNAEGRMIWMSPELLEDLLFVDGRFEIYEELGDAEFLTPFLQSELRGRGLLGGPMVMLRERGASSEDVMMDMLLHLQDTNRALEMAWQLRPPNNPAVEAELLSLLMVGDMLEREMKRALETGVVCEELKSCVEPRDSIRHD